MSWVYVQSESNLWTAGYYTPEGNWNSDSDHNSPDKAAARVHYLNGGGQHQPVNADLLAALEKIAGIADDPNNPSAEEAANTAIDLARIAIAEAEKT